MKVSVLYEDMGAKWQFELSVEELDFIKDVSNGDDGRCLYLESLQDLIEYKFIERGRNCPHFHVLGWRGENLLATLK